MFSVLMATPRGRPLLREKDHRTLSSLFPWGTVAVRIPITITEKTCPAAEKLNVLGAKSEGGNDYGKVILGNHTAVIAARSEQDRIRKFYCDVLGCKVRVKTDEVDRFQLDDVHFCFVWQSTALDESYFLKAIYLELQTDSIEE